MDRLILLSFVFAYLFDVTCSANVTSCDFNPCENGGICQVLNTGYHCLCTQDWTGKNCTEAVGKNVSSCANVSCGSNEKCVQGNASSECICNEDYKRDDVGNCTVGVTDCSSHPCANNGICIDDVNGYSCNCTNDYQGDRCQTKVDACIPNPCQNGGVCRASTAKYECLCPSGFVGLHCEAIHEPCNSDPCLNGDCQHLEGIYFCKCHEGYAGINCEIDIDECENNPCINGNCTDLIANFNCSCDPGWEGSTCQINIDDCSQDPCVHGACTDLVAGYNCSCYSGYEGVNCSQDINECENNPCLNNGSCLDGVATFSCICNGTGYDGELCDVEIDECVLLRPCTNSATCLDRVNDYQCLCHPGFHGKRCEIDENECLSQPCLNNATCWERSDQSLYGRVFNTSFTYEEAAGFACLCKAGYDGKLCEEEIDECLSLNPCANDSTCLDKLADYVCLCSEGFGGKNCSVLLRGCDDHNCSNNATCRPYLQDEFLGIHNYTCSCIAGHVGRYCDDTTTMSFTGNSTVTFVLEKSVADERGISVDFRTTILTGVLSTVVFDDRDDWYLQIVLQNGTIRGSLSTPSGNESCGLTQPVNDAAWHTLRVKLFTNLVKIEVGDEICTIKLSTPSPEVARVHLGSIDRGFIGCIRDFTVDDHKDTLDEEVLLSSNVKKGCAREETCFNDSCSSRGQCVDLWQKYSCKCTRPYVGSDCQKALPPSTFGYMNEESSAYFKLPVQPGHNLDASFFLKTRAQDGNIFTLGGNSTETSGIPFGLKLTGGKIQVIVGEEIYDEFSVLVDDGMTHFVSAVIRSSYLHVMVDGTRFPDMNLSRVFNLTTVDVFVGGYPGASQDKRRRRALTSTAKFFKGTIQDLQVDGIRLLLREEDAEGLTGSESTLLANRTVNVLRGEVSDPVCGSTNHSFFSNPCRNEGVCVVTFNDYVCNCTQAWQGRTCDQPIFCQQVTCPSGLSCVDLSSNMFECVGNVTFQHNTSISYVAALNASTARSVTFRIRTRSINATVLRWSSRTGSVQLELDVSGGMRLEVNGSVIPLLSSTEVVVANGEWHDIKLSVSDDRNATLSVDGLVAVNSVQQSVIGSLLDSLDSVGVGASGNKYSIKGCIADVRIDGHLVPFYNLSELTNHSAALDHSLFSLVSRVEPPSGGCTGDDVCSTSRCANNGSCIDVFNDYKCTCMPGFTDTSCETNIDDCVNVTCSNRGNCSDAANDFVCDCFDGYFGDLCQYESDECLSSPCFNNGTCLDLIGFFRCNCTGTGFVGDQCQLNASLACGGVTYMNAPCKNGGKCSNRTMTDKVMYSCQCPTPFTGRTCETVMNMCENSTCKGSSQCVVNNITWTPSCVGPCSSNPCIHNASCQNEENGYSCTCNEGFVGSRCQYKSLCLEPFCANGGNCSVTMSSVDQPIYSCRCLASHAGERCNFSNPCLNHTCLNGGSCVAMQSPIPTAACQCSSGYTGSSCQTATAAVSNTMILAIGLVGGAGLLLLTLASAAAISSVLEKRSTSGTYSPSKQEAVSSVPPGLGRQLESGMWTEMKPPPCERLI